VRRGEGEIAAGGLLESKGGKGSRTHLLCCYTAYATGAVGSIKRRGGEARTGGGCKS